MTEIYLISRDMNNEIKKENYSIEHLVFLFDELKHIINLIPEKYLASNIIRMKINPEHKVPFRILTAEDNDLNRQLVRAYLLSVGLDTDFAENGSIAIRKMQKKKYDVLLLDMQMPVKNGLETLKEIRDSEQLKNIHVIALTANAIKGDAEKYRSEGCDDYLSKPLKKTKLLEKVQNLFVNKIINEEKKKEKLNSLKDVIHS